MREYELTVIYRTEDDVLKAGKEKVAETLKKQDFTVKKEDTIGERTLAYPIKKVEKGHYQFLIVEGDPAKVIEVDKDLKLNDAVLKYLFVKID